MQLPFGADRRWLKSGAGNAIAGGWMVSAIANCTRCELAAPCTANDENWRATFVAEQSGQAICSSPRTSSSKCDSHSMQTYS